MQNFVTGKGFFFFLNAFFNLTLCHEKRGFLVKCHAKGGLMQNSIFLSKFYKLLGYIVY